MRRPHWLARNHSCETPQLAIWFDTETDQVADGPDTVKHVLRFGWAACRRINPRGRWTAPKWRRFETPGDFWSFVESCTRDRARLWIFAHNIGFDFPVVHGFHQLPARGWELTSAVIDSPPTILTYKRGRRTIKLCDTLNIWRVPLAVLGEQQGMDKLPMPAPDAPRDQWDRYCRRDVEVIMTACLTWWHYLLAHDLGGFAPTLAGQAMRAYRHRFMPARIFVDDNPRALELARRCYTGGRVECWHIGDLRGPLYQVDVNSMYPHVMREFDYPTALLGFYTAATLDELLEWSRKYALCAQVIIETRVPAYAVMRDGRLIFPTGRFTAHLTTPELCYALERGHVIAGGDCAVYDKATLFRSFVDEFYARRLEYAAAGDDLAAWQTKILLNSLYGKFGQRGRRWEVLYQTDDMSTRVWTDYDVDDDTVTEYRQFGGVVQALVEDGESRDSHPAIAAHVTAYARMMLWRLICRAGRQNVFYMDTDCLLVNSAGYARLRPLVHSERLGGLKLEGQYNRVELRGPKDYTFDGRQRVKGIKRGARPVGLNAFEQEQWTNLPGLLRLGDMTAPRTRRVTKRLRRVYEKGRVQAGGRVLPFHLRGECGAG